MIPHPESVRRVADPRTVAQLQSRLETLLGAQECHDECFGGMAVLAVGELALALLEGDKLQACLQSSLAAWVQRHGGGSVAAPWWPTQLPGSAEPAMFAAALAVVDASRGELRPDVTAALRGALLLRLGRASEAATALRAAIVRDARAPERHVDLVLALAQLGDHDAALRALAGLRAQAAQAGHGSDLRWRRAVEAGAAALGEPA